MRNKLLFVGLVMLMMLPMVSALTTDYWFTTGVQNTPGLRSVGAEIIPNFDIDQVQIGFKDGTVTSNAYCMVFAGNTSLLYNQSVSISGTKAWCDLTGIQLNASQKYGIIIYNLTGNIVTQFLAGNSTVINGTNLNYSAGSYYSATSSGYTLYGIAQLWGFQNITSELALNNRNVSIRAHNVYTNQSITNFTAYITNGSVQINQTTTNGTIQTIIPTNSSYLWDIRLESNESGGYFNETYTGVNVSSNVNKSMAQSVYTFTATQKVSNATISGVNFTSVYLTNTTHYMSNGTFTINATKSGYFTKSQSVTAVALTNSSFVIENMTDTRLNLTVRNAITNATVSTFTAQFNDSLYSYSQSNSTTNGTMVIDALTGNWTVYVDASGFALSLTNVSLVAGYNNITVYVYTSESVNFFFYDEQSGNLLTGKNVTIELIGSYASYNYTTSNGTLYADLLTPDAYIARYYATGYTPRFSYITITNRTTQNISLYLLASVNGTNVSVYVLRQDGSQVQGALVKLLKYDLATNSYVLREQVITDYQGLTSVDVQFNAEFYRFLVEYPIGTVALTTDPAYITSTEITLILDSELAGTFWNYVEGAGGDVSFNSGTNNFRFIWSDTNGVITNSCLYIYRLESNYTGTYLGVNCSTASSGTLLFSVSNTTQAQYYATGYFTIGGTDYFVDEAFADLRTVNNWGLLGVLIALGLTVTIVFMFIFVSPQASILSTPIGVTVTNFAGITQFSAWVPIGIFAIAVVIVFAMGRQK